MTQMERECDFCKKDWKYKTFEPYQVQDFTFCDKTCAIDYLFKALKELKEAIK